jgi:hypothetical protein
VRVGLFIKNPEVERKARELARLTGKSLTAVVEKAFDRQLEPEPARPRPTVGQLGDCFACALARQFDALLFFKGDNFAVTDVRLAVYPT